METKIEFMSDLEFRGWLLNILFCGIFGGIIGGLIASFTTLNSPIWVYIPLIIMLSLPLLYCKYVFSKLVSYHTTIIQIKTRFLEVYTKHKISDTCYIDRGKVHAFLEDIEALYLGLIEGGSV